MHCGYISAAPRMSRTPESEAHSNRTPWTGTSNWRGSENGREMRATIPATLHSKLHTKSSWRLSRFPCASRRLTRRASDCQVRGFRQDTSGCQEQETRRKNVQSPGANCASVFTAPPASGTTPGPPTALSKNWNCGISTVCPLVPVSVYNGRTTHAVDELILRQLHCNLSQDWKNLSLHGHRDAKPQGKLYQDCENLSQQDHTDEEKQEEQHDHWDVNH